MHVVAKFLLLPHVCNANYSYNANIIFNLNLVISLQIYATGFQQIARFICSRRSMSPKIKNTVWYYWFQFENLISRMISFQILFFSIVFLSTPSFTPNKYFPNITI